MMKTIDDFAVAGLPSDVIVAAEPAADTPHEVVAADAVPADRMGLDIGPESAARFAAAISEAGTVFWNGPMGVLLDEP
jgi:phosphoglycerate kinase